MPQVNTEIGIKVNEFGDKFKISASFDTKWDGFCTEEFQAALPSLQSPTYSKSGLLFCFQTIFFLILGPQSGSPFQSN